MIKKYNSVRSKRKLFETQTIQQFSLTISEEAKGNFLKKINVKWMHYVLYAIWNKNVSILSIQSKKYMVSNWSINYLGHFVILLNFQSNKTPLNDF